jgi:hypothetical protein
MCVEAIETGEVIKTEAVRQWVRQLAWNLMGVEHHIDALIDIEKIPREMSEEDKRRARTLINSWIQSGNDLIRRIVESPGIQQLPNPVPSSELKAEVDGWVQSVQLNIDQSFSWFGGQFMNDANLKHGSNPAAIAGKSLEFYYLVERVQNRIARLAELLDRI